MRRRPPAKIDIPPRVLRPRVVGARRLPLNFLAGVSNHFGFDRQCEHPLHLFSHEYGLQTVANFAAVRQEGSKSVQRRVEYYNLDAILAVGYLVNSLRVTQLRVSAPRVSGVAPAIGVAAPPSEDRDTCRFAGPFRYRPRRMTPGHPDSPEWRRRTCLPRRACPRSVLRDRG